MSLARRARKSLRGVAHPDDQARRLHASATPTFCWAAQLHRPSRARALRWSAFQRRLFASILAAPPMAGEGVAAHWKRRHQESAVALERLAIPQWGMLQARLYFRACKRLASDATSVLHHMLRWRSRWQQHTLQVLVGHCGSGHRAGRPSRWEEPLAAWVEERHHCDWLTGPRHWTQEEAAFVAWAMNLCDGLPRRRSEATRSEATDGNCLQSFAGAPVGNDAHMFDGTTVGNDVHQPDCGPDVDCHATPVGMQ